MTTPLPPIPNLHGSFPLPAAPLPEFVDRDLPCRNCSYNLKTLPTSGVCPECATPIAQSLKSDFLYASDPRWLKLLNRGALAFIYGVMAVFLGTMHRSSLGSPWWIVTWIGRITELVGAWMLTLPDPSGIGEERLGNLRIATRFFFAARLVVGLIVGALGAPVLAPHYPLEVSVVYLEQLIETLGVLTLLFYLNRLVMRIPNPILAKGLRWGACFYFGLALFGSVGGMSVLLRHFFIWPLMMWVPVLLVLPRLISMFLLMALLSQTRQAINRQAQPG